MLLFVKARAPPSSVNLPPVGPWDRVGEYSSCGERVRCRWSRARAGMAVCGLRMTAFGGRASVVGEAGEVCGGASGAAAGPKVQPADGLGLAHGHVDKLAARSTAPRRTHAQTTSSCWNTLAPAGEASRPPTASIYRIKSELDADGGSAVAGDAIAIEGLGLRPPRRRLTANLPTIVGIPTVRMPG
jgi:hypothetical protein